MPELKAPTKWSVVAAAVVALAFIAMSTGPTRGDATTTQAADKMAVSGSALDLLSAPLQKGGGSEIHTILTGSIKTASPVDLIFHLTSECALWTDIMVVGDSTSQSIASVKLWVELDGKPVAVASDDQGSDVGQVVFCNRAFKMTTENLGQDEKNSTYKFFLSTREANAFNWITTNVGPGTHDIAVRAQLDTNVDGMGNAQAGVGKRTLIVEPVFLAQNAVF